MSSQSLQYFAALTTLLITLTRPQQMQSGTIRFSLEILALEMSPEDMVNFLEESGQVPEKEMLDGLEIQSFHGVYEKEKMLPLVAGPHRGMVRQRRRQMSMLKPHPRCRLCLCLWCRVRRRSSTPLKTRPRLPISLWRRLPPP